MGSLRAPLVSITLTAALLTACGEGRDGEEAETASRVGIPARWIEARTTPTDAELASHARMVDELAKIAPLKAELSYFDNGGAAREIEAGLRQSPGPVRRMDLLTRLARIEVRRGQVDEAIERFERAYQLYKQHEKSVAPPQALNFLYSMALAYLRRAENQNCVSCRTGESCLLPISAAGVHREQAASRRAIVLLKEALNVEPANAVCVWLLNIACMTVGEYPDSVPPRYRIPPRVFAADAPFPRFRNVAGEVGLDCLDLSGGAVVEDIDGDGRLDVLCSTWDIMKAPQLFLSRGDGSFRNASKEWGLEGLFGGLNMNHADYDNDGDVDVLILRGAWFGARGRHPNSLLKNMGDRFVDVTFATGLGDVHYPTQTAAWADYDLDGDLDLFVGNETLPGQPCPSQLFRNDGEDAFTEVAAEAGVTNDRLTKGTSWGDFDGDGDPDLYVSNLRGPNRLYVNLGDGRFEDRAPKLGVAGPVQSFPTWFWDYDNDGVLDLFVASYAWKLDYAVLSYAKNQHRWDLASLYRGDGRGGFEDVGLRVGLRRLNITMGSNFGDLDNDGYPDFYLGTGFPNLDGLLPNVMYWNRAGERFLDVSASGGFSHLQKGHGVAFADLDRDGDQDVFEQMGGAYPVDAFQNALYENPGFGNNWLIVELVGTSCNRSAIGAHLAAEIDDAGTRRTVHAWVNTGGSFGSSPLRRHVGIGKATRVERLAITWPGSNEAQVLEEIDAGQFIRVTQGIADFEKVPYEPTPFKR